MILKVIIAGSRTFDDYQFLESTIDDIYGKWANENGNIEVVSGGAKGADTLGEKFATYNDLVCTKFPAQWDKLGRSAGMRRNIQMAKYANEAVIFWDGESSGSKHMIGIMRTFNKPVHVVLYKSNEKYEPKLIGVLKKAL